MTVKELIDTLGKIPAEQQDNIEVFAWSGCYGSGSPMFDVYVVTDMQDEFPRGLRLVSTKPLF